MNENKLIKEKINLY